MRVSGGGLVHCSVTRPEDGIGVRSTGLFGVSWIVTVAVVVAPATTASGNSPKPSCTVSSARSSSRNPSIVNDFEGLEAVNDRVSGFPGQLTR